MTKPSVLPLQGDSILIKLLLILLLIKSGSGHNEYGESSCGSGKPAIRFPSNSSREWKMNDGAKTSKLSFFNCSSVEHQHLRNLEQWYYADSQDMISCPIYVFDPGDNVLRLDLTCHTKMFDIIAHVSAYEMHKNQLNLRWFKANCSECKAIGKKCKWKNNRGDIDCFDCKDK
ncbi:hypothetical protein JHK82_039527 [Glycine max]|nr:hypothetical protein JHK86_039714 [Glycine max]KAG5110304.1 hypothetical protein JHK82_039527 [Glycine max]